MSDDEKKRKLAAGIIFYNDVKGIKRLLDSLDLGKGVDLAICIDGRFPAHPGPSDLSDDGSRETVLSYHNTLLLDYPASEYEKRSKYLAICEQQKVDYLLILDTDEYAAEGGDWQTFRRNMIQEAEVKQNGLYNVFAVLMETNSKEYIKTVDDKPYATWVKDNDIEYGYYPRLWYKPGEMMYSQGTHYKFKNKDRKKRLNYQDSAPAIGIVDGVRFLHRNAHMKTEQLNARRAYQLGFLVPYESKTVGEWYKHYSWPGINATVDEVQLD